MSSPEKRLADLANTRRYRQRQAGLLPPLPSCEACGKASIRGAHAPPLPGLLAPHPRRQGVEPGAGAAAVQAAAAAAAHRPAAGGHA